MRNPTPWTVLAGGVVALLVASTIPGGCSGLRDECGDGLDNDGDGLIDGSDPACQAATLRYNAQNANCGQGSSGLTTDNPACQVTVAGASEGDDPACGDRQDNDGDGLVDYPDDYGCTALSDDSEDNPACSDGEDNDGDGLLDWEQDPGCRNNARNTTESNDYACGDGRDNDGDGKVDYPADPGCSSRTDSSEVDPQCSDGLDNDGDGRVDFPNDPDCTSGLADRERSFACADGVDNDYDGAVDGADLGCASRFDDDETNPACSDGRDNDGDGRIDFPADPGCANVLDAAEDKPECSDGIDNDLNGYVDFPFDPGCDSPEDDGEAAACSDGIDNDGDGLVDFPYDPGCTSPSTNSEGNANSCADGLDNDGDGFVDYPADPGCSARTDVTEGDTSGDCSDGLDNDGDGFIDRTSATNLGDPACDANYVWERLDPLCDDGADNDGDGTADFNGVDLNFDGRFDAPGEFPPDPGCYGIAGYAEAPEPPCADRLDNDGDGSADWNGIDLNGDGRFDPPGEMPPDWLCVMPDPTTGAVPTIIQSQRRRSERFYESPANVYADFAQCRDGVDNDGDGFVDFQPEFLSTGGPNPNYLTGDPQCTDALDNTEAN